MNILTRLSVEFFSRYPRTWDRLDMLRWWLYYRLPIQRKSAAHGTRRLAASLLQAGYLTIDEAWQLSELANELSD